ncbi:MAG: hypothetical protein RLZZ450_6359 [Pseudomonadota bacterium]|jgi:hypothetical protein
MTALSIASSGPVVKLALRMALVVGSLLNLINQGDALFGTRDVHVLPLLSTYLVPYCVATYSATRITLQRERR